MEREDFILEAHGSKTAEEAERMAVVAEPEDPPEAEERAAAKLSFIGAASGSVGWAVEA